MEQIQAEVEIDFKDGKRTIEMVCKKPFEIEDCDEGKIVILNLKNGESYTGIFKGMDGDSDLMLSPVDGGGRIGLKVSWVEDYFEEVK